MADVSMLWGVWVLMLASVHHLEGFDVLGGDGLEEGCEEVCGELIEVGVEVGLVGEDRGDGVPFHGFGVPC